MEDMRVLLAEDQFLLRDGLTRLLELHGIDVVAALDHGEQIMDAYLQHRPELLLLDNRLPPYHRDEGLRAAIAIRTRFAHQPVMLLSQYVERLYLDELLDQTGGTGLGYLLKDRVFEASSFIEALQQVAAGATVLDPEVVSGVVEAGLHRDKLSRLSPRENETLVLMANGQSNQHIATTMSVSEKAVAKNINAIFTKLDLPPDAAQSSRRVLAVLTYLRA